MRGVGAKQAGEGSYRYDAEGNLIVDGAESEEQRLAVEAAVLYKEGMSSNHPADIATHNAAAGEGEAPIEEEGYEGESPEEEAARVERNRQVRERWDERQRHEEDVRRVGEQREDDDDDANQEVSEDTQEEYEEPVPEPEPEDDGRRGRRNRNR